MNKQKVFSFLFLLLCVGGTVYVTTRQFGDKQKMLKDLSFSTPNSLNTLLIKSIDEIEIRTNDAIATAQKGLVYILSIADSDRTFENTVQALDDVESQFSITDGTVLLVEMTHPEKSMRDAASVAQQKMRAFEVEAFMNRGLYRAFKVYVEKGKQKLLSDAQQYYLREAIRAFERSGFALPDEQFERVKEIKKELGDISQAFSNAIAADSSSIYVAQDALAGVDEDFIRKLTRDEKGLVRLGCDYPTISAVMPHCHNHDVRKQLSYAFNNRAYPENIDRLHALIKKRHQLATLLGYESYAHLDTVSGMVKTPERAEAFLRELIEKASLKEQQEFERLSNDLPSTVTLNRDGKYNAWDVSYISQQYKKKHFDLDARKVAEYFPLEKTINGLFEIYQHFLGLNFSFVNVEEVWDEHVQCIEVRTKNDNQLRGYIFLDLFPRDGKYSHACHLGMMPALKNTSKDGSVAYSPSVAVVIANFPRSTKDMPSLLTHNNVITFFHEFGHAMHGLLGATELAGHAGTSVKRDFVEMPSQMFEEWMWDKDMLKKISSHYQTGEPLSDELIEKMLKLKTFDGGYYVQRQGYFALLSLACFNSKATNHTDALCEELYAATIRHISFYPETHMQASFGHLTGYGAKYYGYLWSKVFALDLFSHIKKEGLLNPEVSRKFVNDILAKGGSADPEELLLTFLGREPNQEAFLKDLGL